MKKLKARIRDYFIAGLVAVIPITFTWWVITIMLKKADQVLQFLPDRYNPSTYMPFPLPGLGAILVIITILIIGVLVKNYVGFKVMGFGENLLCRIPIVRPLYSAVKQLLTALFSPGQDFKRVVLVEYPRKGIWCLAFVTGVSYGELQEVTARKVINVFLPTTPNPTSGFYLLVPEEDAIPLKMDVESAFKLLISGGLVSDNGSINGNRKPNSKPVPPKEAPPEDIGA